MGARLRTGRMWADLGGIALAAAAALAVFAPALQPGRALWGQDFVLWLPEFVRTYTHGLFVPRWFPYFYAGIAQQFQFLSQSFVVAMAMPPVHFHAVAFALDAAIAGVGMWFLCRAWRLRGAACAVGALAYPLSNHLLTWASAGHLWKYDTACWTPWLLMALERAHATGRRSWFLWAGAFLGLHLLGGEVQLAYYVGLVLAAMTAARVLGRWWRRRAQGGVPFAPATVRAQVVGHVLCVVVAAVFGAEVIHNYVHLLQTQEVVAKPTADARWTFATEFSLPPEETASLALGGGLFGYSLDGPHYWGRSVARITDDYLGIAALCLAVCAVAVRRDRRSAWWAAVAAGALLLAYGRYLPGVYRALYALPFMGLLRNPNRWLFVTAWAASLLAALGADAWLRAGADESSARRLRYALAGLGGVVLVLVLLALWMAVAPEWWRDRLYGRLAAGGADVGEVGYRLRVMALAVRRAALLGVAWVALTGAWLLAGGRWPAVLRGAVAVLLVAIVGLDLALHARPFIRTYDAATAYARTELIDRLEEPPLGGRVKIWQDTPQLRDLVSHQLPYFGIGTLDVIASRRPPEYTAVLRAWREGRLPTATVLHLFGVTTLLAPGPLPPGAPAADPVGVYDGVHAFAVRDAAPRAEVVGDFNVLAPGAILSRMAEPGFDPRAEVLLTERPPVRLAAFQGPVAGRARLEGATPHRVEFTVSASRPAMLVVHDLFDRYWRASVAGTATPILRADGFLRAVAVPAGEDVPVVMTFQPPRWPWALTLLGWAGVLLGAARAGRRWLRAERAAAAEAAA